MKGHSHCNFQIVPMLLVDRIQLPMVIFFQEKHRINKDGYFVTTSHKTRQMLLNQGDCINKIRTAVFNSMKVNEPPTEEYLKEVQRRQVINYLHLKYKD